MVQPMHTRRPSRQRDRISKVPTNPEEKGPRRRRTRVAEGIYKDQYGLATTVKVNGIQREMRFPAGTSLKAIRKERDELKASLRRQPPATRQTLAHDTARYLDQVGTTVSLVNRQREIEVWLPRFGHLRTLSLPGHVNSLNGQLREWRRSLAASTVNHRRNALTNLVKILYGRRAAAELVDLERFKAPPPKPRWIDRDHVADVLEQIPPATKTAPRLWLIHWTGMRPSQMGRLTLDDFRLDEPIPFIAVPRGKGGRLAAVPLVEEGLGAARAFIAADAFGPWSCPSANKALAAAARRAGRPPFTVYQIRHSFSAALRRTGADIADIQDLYGHTDPEITQIYAPPTLAKHLGAIERLRSPKTGAPEAPQHGSTLRLVSTHDSDEGSKRLAVPAGSQHRESNKSFVFND